MKGYKDLVGFYLEEENSYYYISPKGYCYQANYNLNKCFRISKDTYETYLEIYHE